MARLAQGCCDWAAVSKRRFGACMGDVALHERVCSGGLRWSGVWAVKIVELTFEVELLRKQSLDALAAPAGGAAVAGL